MLAEACYSSARENRWVSMREFERDLGIQFGP
jgi:hypothetical protein